MNITMLIYSCVETEYIILCNFITTQRDGLCQKINKRLYLSAWFSPCFILYLFKLMRFPDDSKRILYKICRRLTETSVRSELPPQINSRNWKEMT